MSYLQRIFRSNLPMNRWISSIENNNLLINQLQQQQQLNRFKLLSTTTTTTNNQNIKYDNETLNRMIQQNKVVIFMKGIPEQPRCGFSNAVVQVLRMHGVEFQSYNVLESDELRQAIKNFTSWPTIPQIFLNGEFIGGCDILLEKHQNGELIDDLAKIGIKSKINDDNNDDNSSSSGGQNKSK